MTRAKKTAWRKQNRLLKRLFREGKLKFDYYGYVAGFTIIESLPRKVKQWN